MNRGLKKTPVYVLIVLLLCLGLAPVLMEVPYALTEIPYNAASSPVAKVSLAPFIHVRNSTVTTLNDGIGYFDSVDTITDGVLAGTYTNTTEIHDTATTYRLMYINIYGDSQITINNTDMSGKILYVYGSSQVALIDSIFMSVKTYDSSNVTLKNNSSVFSVHSFDESEVSVINSTVSDHVYLYDNSRVYASKDSQISNTVLYNHSYLNANNCTIYGLQALDFSTGRITNNSKITTLRSYDTAHILVNNSWISVGVWYGLACIAGSLTVDGSTLTLLCDYRNTTTIINSTHHIQGLVSVSALGSSTVKILHNNTVTQVYAHDSSSVNLENDTVVNIKCFDYSDIIFKNGVNTLLNINCYDHSSLTLQNVTGDQFVYLYDQSLAMIKNISTASNLLDLYLYTYNQSMAIVEYLDLSGFTSSCWVASYDSSVIEIINVNTTNDANSSLFSYDLSVMSIESSNITMVGYAVKSNGDIWITNGGFSGSYNVTTNWHDSIIGDKSLRSIAIVGRDTATIEGSNVSASLYLHDRGKLNISNSSCHAIYMYDSATGNGVNVTFSTIRMFDWSSASLSNVTVNVADLYDSAKMTCIGSETATSTFLYIRVTSYYPEMANVTINNCTVKNLVSGYTWIFKPVLKPHIPLPIQYIIQYTFYYYFLRQPSTFPLLLAGGAIAAILAVAAVILWRRRA